MEFKDEERMATIPLIAHEVDVARYVTIIKWLLCIIAILIVIIGVGVYELTSCDFTDVSIDSNDSGVANYLKAGTSGVINNAEDSGSGEDAQEEKE